MSIRERIQAKQRRRSVIPILVSDPSQDVVELQAVSVALGQAGARGDDAAVAQLQSQAEELGEKVQSHWAHVEILALPSAEWEAAVAAYQTITVNEDGPTAVMDWATCLAPILAASCVDPELQDAEWWQAQLSSDGWSEGDLDAVRGAVLRLNVEAAEARAPKD